MPAPKSRALKNLQLQLQLGQPTTQQPALIGQSPETSMKPIDAHHTVNLAGFFGLGSQANNPGPVVEGGQTPAQGQALAKAAAEDIAAINASQGPLGQTLGQKVGDALSAYGKKSLLGPQEKLKRAQKFGQRAATALRNTFSSGTSGGSGGGSY
jgi:hypothetical protein